MQSKWQNDKHGKVDRAKKQRKENIQATRMEERIEERKKQRTRERKMGRITARQEEWHNKRK